MAIRRIYGETDWPNMADTNSDGSKMATEKELQLNNDIRKPRVLNSERE